MTIRPNKEPVRFGHGTTIQNVKDAYPQIRQAIVQIPDAAELINWVEHLRRPAEANEFAFRIAFVIMVSGFRYCICKRISEFVKAALVSGQPVFNAFRHPGKAAAIQLIYNDRQRLFEEFGTVPDERIPNWCETLPWVGPVTKYQAARDLGMNVAKPDRHMLRLGASIGETVQVICEHVAESSGDRIATVDLVLWYALAHGSIRIEC